MADKGKGKGKQDKEKKSKLAKTGNRPHEVRLREAAKTVAAEAAK